MLRRALLVAAICGLGSVAIVQCGSSKAGLGEFCDADADCSPGLLCENNICVSGGSDDCTPACQEFQTCFQGSCVDIGDPNDKDGDGAPAGVDCDDFNAQINPDAHEYCDGVDNNCDGLVDEGCPACRDGDVQPCGTDIGQCMSGVQTCNSGAWGVCSGTAPQPERCDGKDNDCDGLTDEVCPCQSGDQVPCGLDVGICAAGMQTCEEGAWSGCAGGELPRAELCNGQDDDCDGTVDDGFGLGLACDGEGECGAGVIECSGDLDVRCDTMPGGSNDQSGQEQCDGLDNDCDGLTDEGLEADQAPDTCALAQELGGLPDNVEGGSRLTVVGNLWPPDDEDWYKVTAIDDVNEDLEDGCDSFHFAARFDSNPGALLLDIYTDGCSPEGLECRGADSFNHFYDFNDIQGGQPVGQCGCQGVDPAESVEGLNLCTDDTKTFYIRVHAGEGSVQTCENYELTFSNGVPVPIE